MHKVATHAAYRAGGRPYVIKLYLHSGKYGHPQVIRALHAETCNVTATTFPTSRQNQALVADAVDGEIRAEFICAAEGGPGAMLVTAFPRNLGGNSTIGNSSMDTNMQGYKAKPRTYKWGAQGLYFSDGLTRRRLADCYLLYTTKIFEKQRRLKVWYLEGL